MKARALKLPRLRMKEHLQGALILRELGSQRGPPALCCICMRCRLPPLRHACCLATWQRRVEAAGAARQASHASPSSPARFSNKRHEW